jgi:histidinol-phosphate aminotransferase
MPNLISRRNLLKSSGIAMSASLVTPRTLLAAPPPTPGPAWSSTARLSLNENAFGPSPRVVPAIQHELARINLYADDAAAEQFAQQVAAHERIPAEQVVLGEILGLLGLYLSSQGGPGGEFVYSTPGYLALIDAAAELGGIGVPVPLDAQYRNDLPSLRAKVNAKTRAIYLINPHNPTGTVNEDEVLKRFLRDVSTQAVAIVDEAYLEYATDFQSRSAVSLVREGANVMVFRTFDKIHGLAGMPIGYFLAPAALADALRQRGAGDAESLGRFNLAAAAAALVDTAHVERVRTGIARERQLWFATLRKLKLPHTEAHGDFVFFDTGRPQTDFAAAMLAKGIDIGRAHPPYTNWARITVGLPEENRRAQAAMTEVLAATI